MAHVVIFREALVSNVPPTISGYPIALFSFQSTVPDSRTHLSTKPIQSQSMGTYNLLTSASLQLNLGVVRQATASLRLAIRL